MNVTIDPSGFAGAEVHHINMPDCNSKTGLLESFLIIPVRPVQGVHIIRAMTV